MTAKQTPQLELYGFAKRLKDARIAAKLSQQDLADKLHTNKGMISGYEAAIYDPRQSVIPELAKALDVSVSWLMLGEEQPVAHKVAAYDGGYDDLPDEAKKRVDEYIELQRMKSKMDESKSH